MTFLETDFKALGARLKHAQVARKSFVSKLHKLRRGPPRKESIFTDDQRAMLIEVSTGWVTGRLRKSGWGMKHKTGSRGTTRDMGASSVKRISNILGKHYANRKKRGLPAGTHT
jgi:hypothetical protein